MDHNYPELNPVVILRLSYLEPKEEVLGVIYLRKESVERFKSNVKELLGDKFDLVELNSKSNFDEDLRKSKPITSVRSDVCFMLIPFVIDSRIWKFTAPLNCIEYKITKLVSDAKELFGNVELDMMTALQLKGEIAGHEVDVEKDLKTVEKILAKYELKLTAEQKCKFLEELVKVLG